jgi:hypothetical protein
MPDMQNGAETQPGRKGKALVAAGVLVLAVIPILLVPFPPSTDLPQHIAQVRLFAKALADPRGPYIIQWLSPDNLVYLFLLAFWAILPIEMIARATLILVVLLWTAAIHGLGGGRKRAAASAVVASLFLFNQSFTGGFLNFLIGFPVFALWFALTAKEPRIVTRKLWLALAGTSILLYASHALWFAAGAAWLLIIGLLRKAPFRTIGLRLTALLPCGVIALLWYPGFVASRSMAGFDVAPHWWSLSDRLTLVMPSVFCGIRGPAGTLTLVFIILWVALSVWQNRHRLREAWDRDLLIAALFFAAIAAIAPDKYLNTIFFSSRWLPEAAIFLLLALPAPSFGRLPPAVFAMPVALVFFMATAITWVRYDAHDLSGFEESLEAIAPQSRVLGLDLVKVSGFIKDRPFLQLFAYAQVFKGGELNFSFAEHSSSLVAYRVPREVPWTPSLEWDAENVDRADFEFFDFVVVNGNDKVHEMLGSIAEISPLTRSGRWRAYTVNNPP